MEERAAKTKTHMTGEGEKEMTPLEIAAACGEGAFN